MPWPAPTGNQWRVAYRVGGRGAPIQYLPTLHPTKSAARLACAGLAVQLKARKPVRFGDLLTLDELLTRYQASRIAKGRDSQWVALTITRIKRICADNNWRLVTDITASAVQSWVTAGGSPRRGADLRAALWWARDYANQPVDDATLVALRPTTAARRPSPDLLTDATVSNAQHQADAISASFGAVIHCLIAYGWRPITAARLTVGDVDLEHGRITTSVKGGDVVRHPVSADTLDRLRPLCQKRPASAPLFTNPHTGDAWPTDGRGGIPRICKRLLSVASYDLKRWSISTALEAGEAPQTVALFTGHRTVSQVLRYARTNEQRAKESLARVVKHREARNRPKPDNQPAVETKNTEKAVPIDRRKRART